MRHKHWVRAAWVGALISGAAAAQIPEVEVGQQPAEERAQEEVQRPVTAPSVAGDSTDAPESDPGEQQQAEGGAPAEVQRPVGAPSESVVRTDAPEPERTGTAFSVGVLSSYGERLHGFATALISTGFSHAVRGMQLSFVHNQADDTLKGMQLALGLNTVRADALGFQLSVVGNTADGAMKGLQSSVGFNTVGTSLTGAQLTAGVNVTGGDVRGLQGAAGLNIAAKSLTGLQAAAGVNVVRERLRGVQTTAGVGYAGRVQGAQLSLINVSGDVAGAQVGLINVARNVRGAQVGLVNVAGSSDASVGLLSLVPGGIHVQAFASDAMLANVALKMGGQYVHTLLIVGMQPDFEGKTHTFSTGAAIGVHLPITPRLYTDVDLIGSTLRKEWSWDSSNVLGQLRVVAGLQLAHHFSVFAGVTANSFVDWNDGSDFHLSEGYGWKATTEQVSIRVWPGVVAGIQL